ncbi:MAG: HEAT repeat domain-containing protein [Planctomycetes bacterium]|nr:HEAT repeat domain-containing protein [Planctomycetota bacterium]MCP4772465.1 HEAT repeat domain-containing protein [Planctomycetota bacterium]MCP4860142.1 HEAT repeat domain-containing protein [Planctomycetota bacterium]
MATRSEGGGKSSSGMIFPLVLGLIACGGVIYLYLQQDKMRSDSAMNLNNSVIELAGSISDQEKRSNTNQEALTEELDGQKAIVQGGFSDLLTSVAGLDQAITALRTQVEGLEGLADGQTSLKQETRALRTQMQVTEDSVREVRKGLEFLRDGFADLERKMVVATAAPPKESGFNSEVQKLLTDLKADDPLTRVAAIEELGKHQDPALIPYVEPMLQDTYEMNRFYAAYTLGEWQAMASVPALIEALDDDFAFVADAVNEALISIAKEEMGFDSKGSAADRAKAITRWQGWWKKNAPKETP